MKTLQAKLELIVALRSNFEKNPYIYIWSSSSQFYVIFSVNSILFRDWFHIMYSYCAVAQGVSSGICRLTYLPLVVLVIKWVHSFIFISPVYRPPGNKGIDFNNQQGILGAYSS